MDISSVTDPSMVVASDSKSRMMRENGWAVEESWEQEASTNTMNLFGYDLALRISVFVLCLIALIVVVTAKQTESIVTPFFPQPLRRSADFSLSPAFIYLVAATSFGCLYSISTALVSFLSMSRPSPPKKLLLLLAIEDALMGAILGSAGSAGAAVGYVGLRGNKHVPWFKICFIFDDYCKHLGASVALSLNASFLLLLLVPLSTYSLYRCTK